MITNDSRIPCNEHSQYDTEKNQIASNNLQTNSCYCHVCKRLLASPQALAVHNFNFHDAGRPFPCTKCDKSFVRKAELTNHQRIHSGDRPFKCELCDRTFRQNSNLISHVRLTHKAERRHKCEKCQAKFSRRRLLIYHFRSKHSGERPYKCQDCDKDFVSSSGLKRHKKGVHDTCAKKRHKEGKRKFAT